MRLALGFRVRVRAHLLVVVLAELRVGIPRLLERERVLVTAAVARGRPESALDVLAVVVHLLRGELKVRVRVGVRVGVRVRVRVRVNGEGED